MPLIVEDGTAKPDAQSYISQTDADALLALEPFLTKWGTLVDAVKEQYLAKATQWIDGLFSFVGSRATAEQALSWPRINAADSEGIIYDSTDIPAILPKVTALYAAQLAQDGNPESAADAQRGIAEIKVDVIEVKFDPKDRKPQISDSLAMMLRTIGRKRGCGGAVKLIRT